MVKKRKQTHDVIKEENKSKTIDQASQEATTSTEGDVPVSPPKQFPFKNPQYLVSKGLLNSAVRKSRGWKTLKQITSNEKPHPYSGVTWSSIDASNSKKPCQKYSDLSGLPAKYRDPSSQLFYYNSDEFLQIKMLSNDVINGYIELRKCNV